MCESRFADMRPLGGGRLVQVSSGTGQAAFPGLSLYCATKWGIEGFFDSLAQEVADFGIQTTLVEPGTIGQTLGPQVCSVLSWTPIAKARSVCCARWRRAATLRQETRQRWRKQLWRHSKPKLHRYVSLLVKMSSDISRRHSPAGLTRSRLTRTLRPSRSYPSVRCTATLAARTSAALS